MLRRPRFDFGSDSWEAGLAARPWHPKDRTIGGQVTSQAGIAASYVVRRDALVELTVRFHEDEWPAVLALVAYGQTGATLGWWPDAEQSSESIEAYLDGPAALERWRPTRVGDFPRVLELTLLLRAKAAPIWRQYFQVAAESTLPPGVEYVTVQGEIVTVDGEPVTIGGSGGGGGGDPGEGGGGGGGGSGEGPGGGGGEGGGGGGTPPPGGGGGGTPGEGGAGEENALFVDTYEGGAKSGPQNGVSYGSTAIGSLPSGDNIIVVPDAGNASGYALGLTYGGNPDLTDDVKLEQHVVFPDLLDSCYVEMRILTPDNYYHRDATGPDNNKLLRLWDKSYAGTASRPGDVSVVHVGMSTLPLNDGSGGSQLIVEYNDGTGTGNHGTGPWTHIFLPGTEYVIGFQVDLPTGIGTLDGRIRVWINGALVYDRTGLKLAKPSTAVGSGIYIRNGYFPGWSNSGFTETTTMKLRRLLVAHRRAA